jgi:integrase
LWINEKGEPLTASGIYLMVSHVNDMPGMRDELARLAPGQRFHPHLFRHIWAKYLALSEVPGFAMMVMGGWSDLKLVQHYAAAYAQEKAWSYINKASPLSNIV